MAGGEGKGCYVSHCEPGNHQESASAFSGCAAMTMGLTWLD